MSGNKKEPHEEAQDVGIIEFDIHRNEGPYDILNIQLAIKRRHEDLSDVYRIIDKINQLKTL